MPLPFLMPISMSLPAHAIAARGVSHSWDVSGKPQQQVASIKTKQLVQTAMCLGSHQSLELIYTVPGERRNGRGALQECGAAGVRRFWRSWFTCLLQTMLLSHKRSPARRSQVRAETGAGHCSSAVRLASGAGSAAGAQTRTTPSAAAVATLPPAGAKLQQVTAESWPCIGSVPFDFHM